MPDNSLYDLLQSLDPETLQTMIDAGLAPEQIALQGQQAQRGMTMAQTPSAEGRNVGNTYVASSPLEHLANALQRMRGEQQLSQATKAQQAALGQQGAGRLAYLKGIAGQPPPDVGAAPEML